MSEVRLRPFPDIKALANGVSESDMDILRSDEYAGPDASPEDFHARRLLLCHNQYDRTGERFPQSYLNRFADTIPGKSVLAMHDSGGYCGGGQLPLARFFKAGTTWIDEPAFPMLVVSPPQPDDEGGSAGLNLSMGNGPTDGGPIPMFAPQAKRVTYLNCGFYFPNDDSTEGMRKYIDLGVYKHVSIGFRYDDVDCDICGASYIYSDCRHLMMQYDKDAGRLCTGTYSGNPEMAEALEGSIVHLGAQPRARLTKALRNGDAIDPERFATVDGGGVDRVALKEFEAVARKRFRRRSWGGADLKSDDGGIRISIPAAMKFDELLRRESNGEFASNGKGVRTSLKSASGDPDLPLADREREWDASAAVGRVRKWASSDGSGDKQKIDWTPYAKAFFYKEDADGDPNFGHFHLPYADDLDGELHAIPRGIFAAAARLDQTEMSDDDRDAVRARIGAYYKRMRDAWNDDDVIAPWEQDDSDDDDGKSSDTDDTILRGAPAGLTLEQDLAAALGAVQRAAALHEQRQGKGGRLSPRHAPALKAIGESAASLLSELSAPTVEERARRLMADLMAGELEAYAEDRSSALPA